MQTDLPSAKQSAIQIQVVLLVPEALDQNCNSTYHPESKIFHNL